MAVRENQIPRSSQPLPVRNGMRFLLAFDVAHYARKGKWRLNE
jgi:hypothetical protein